MSRLAPAPLLALALAAAAPAADWAGKPDPAPKDRPAVTADPVADVTVPKFGFTTTVAFADQGGPFVALIGGGGSDGGVKVYDLRTGKPAAEVTGEFRIQKPVALSPDGRHLAGAAHGVRGAAAAVIEIESGKVVHEFPAGRLNVEWLGFAGPDRLLVSARDRDTGATVYDLETGKAVKTLALGGRSSVRAVSPGGAYLAVGTDAGVRVLRLGTGDEVGTLKPADAGPGQSCQGLAFSPDGKHLAGLFGFTDHKVSVWSLADGKLARTVALDKSGVRGGSDNRLEWAADGSAWLLFNEVVADPETGKPLWRVPASRGFDQARRLASAHAVVAWEPAADGAHEYRLRVLSKPKAEVAAVRDAIRSGGTALDALLPAAREPDLTDAKSVEVPLAGVDWVAKPDPAGEQTKVARQPVPLLFRAGQVEAAYVGRGERPAAVFELTDAAGPRSPDPAADGQARRVERVDLYTGRVTGRVSLPAGLRLLGAGPDTGLVLTTDAGKVRVDAWNPADGKHVAGWRPYAKDREAERVVAFAAALGPDRVLTVSAVGKVVLWNLPDLKPAYLAEVPGLTLPTLTPGGKYLIGWQRTAFRVLDVATGEPVGDLLPGFTVRGGTDGPKAIAVRPDGAEAAAVVGKANGPPQLVRWDLQTGKATEATAYGPPAPPAPRPRPDRRGGFPPGYQPPPPMYDFPTTPVIPSRLGYAGADHLLADGRDLYSLKHNAVVWTYALSPAGEGQVIGPRADGRVWYLAGTGAGGEAALVAAAVPGAEASKQIKAATEGTGAVVKPGAKVAVKLELTGAGAEAVGPKVLAELKQVWKDRGLTVVEDGADLTVKLTVAQKETDRVLDMFPPFRPADPNQGRRGVKVIELACAATVTTAEGKKVWEAPAATLPMRSPYELGLQGVAPEEAEKALHRRTWDQVPGWAARAALPRFLAIDEDGRAVTLPGRSLLTAGGVLPPPANE